MEGKKSKSASFLLSEEKEAEAPGEKQPIKEKVQAQDPGVHDQDDDILPPLENKTKRVYMLMRPSLHKDLSKLAKKKRISLNEFMHRILQEYIDTKG